MNRYCPRNNKRIKESVEGLGEKLESDKVVMRIENKEKKKLKDMPIDEAMAIVKYWLECEDPMQDRFFKEWRNYPSIPNSIYSWSYMCNSINRSGIYCINRTDRDWCPADHNVVFRIGDSISFENGERYIESIHEWGLSCETIRKDLDTHVTWEDLAKNGMHEGSPCRVALENSNA